jgi:hypothetical protein
MKYLLPLFLLLFTVHETSAQLKIDPKYALVINDSVITNGSNMFFMYNPNNMAIREIATGKTCAIVSAEWIFSIRGSIYRDTRAEDIKTHLNMCRPKDAIFIEKIKLASGCLPYPGQIAFGVH